MIKTLVFVVSTFPSLLSLTDPERGAFAWNSDIISFDCQDSQKQMNFIETCHLFDEKWIELPQPIFWQKVMVLPPDSAIVNIASNRHIITRISMANWDTISKVNKTAYKDSLKLLFNLGEHEEIYITTGKNHFYKFDAVIPQISRGIEVFAGNFVDPWYAQAILLIESPGVIAKSNAGAYGPFQLMKAVAIHQGLTVNSKLDERADFDRSAWAASQLIKNICIPEAKKILNAKNIEIIETDLWFRLFVMHIYHAGASNVAKVVTAINPKEGGQSLITKMWQTKAGGFGNASQNYSQVVLAALLTLDHILKNDKNLEISQFGL
jgi:hypothetical protein